MEPKFTPENFFQVLRENRRLRDTIESHNTSRKGFWLSLVFVNILFLVAILCVYCVTGEVHFARLMRSAIAILIINAAMFIMQAVEHHGRIKNAEPPKEPSSPIEERDLQAMLRDAVVAEDYELARRIQQLIDKQPYGTKP